MRVGIWNLKGFISENTSRFTRGIGLQIIEGAAQEYREKKRFMNLRIQLMNRISRKL